MNSWYKVSANDGPPDLETDVKYAITINPSDKKQGYGRGINRMRTAYEYIVNEHLLEWKKFGIEVELIWESKLPPHPKRSRYHYHGYIVFSTSSGIFEFHNRLWDRLRDDFNTKIVVIDSPKEWSTYLAKQQPLMEPMCKHYRVPSLIKTSSIKLVSWRGEGHKNEVFKKL